MAALKQGLGDRLVALALFGSQARGDARYDSDYDIFVVARGLPANSYDRQLALRPMLPLRWGTAVSFVAKTPDEVDRKLLPLYLDLSLDAKVLYDPTGFLADRLTRVRRIIESNHLVRQRRRGGWVWDWQSPRYRKPVIEWTTPLPPIPTT